MSLLLFLSCASPEAPFEFQMLDRGVHTLDVTDASSGEPIVGAVVGLRAADTGPFLARGVVTQSGAVSMRVSLPAHADGLSLVALHPDYELTTLEGERLTDWLAGSRDLALPMQRR